MPKQNTSNNSKDSIHNLDHQIPPTQLTIFGGTGDLALHYLLPTLIHMDAEGLLPDNFGIVGTSRKELTPRDWLDMVVKENPKIKFKEADLNHFVKKLRYFSADVGKPESYKEMVELLKFGPGGSADRHVCFNRLYYFATSPEFFGPVTTLLNTAQLLEACSTHKRTIRVLIEKPFGDDVKSAQALNKLLLKYFNESQIYRIDHYLGKETVQNLLVVRFANDFLEPIWNSKYIDHIEISALEEEGTGGRVGFYNQTGALKDFVQNHILHMLALLAMDQPKDLKPESIRNQKVKVLRALRPFTASRLSKDLIRAQYTSGVNVPGYTEEVGHKSNTETFVALKTFIDVPRWKNVPFYLRTGKRLPEKITEISVHFKKLPHGIFDDTKRSGNVLTFRIQPNEQVRMQINNKIPGFGIALHAGSLEFGYKAEFKEEIPPAYERLLLDFAQGDQRLFLRSDEIEAAWKYIDSITKRWTIANAPLYKYSAGSTGPEAAEKFMSKDKRAWWTR